MTESLRDQFDRLCALCNQRYGDHSARKLHCPIDDGKAFHETNRFAVVAFKGHPMHPDDLEPLTAFPTDAKARKQHPVGTGVLDYFPDALMAVANCSWVGNEQHNPGQPLHWAREKSTDEADALIRHFLERGKIDTDGVRHSAKMAWRALALLQKEIEAARR